MPKTLVSDDFTTPLQPGLLVNDRTVAAVLGRTIPLTKEEKAELSTLLEKLRILPNNGQVTLHCNNGKVVKVEPRWSV